MTVALTETLALLITANGAEASTALDDLGLKLTKLKAQSEDSGKAIGAAVTVGAVIAGAALLDMVKKGTEALSAQQVIDAQTQAALQSTGAVANVTASHIAALADSISGYSGKSTDAIKQTANLLLTFTNIQNTPIAPVFDDTTKAVFDMAQALGEDATTAATQLGKALQNPTTGLTALGRAGVTFTATQKKAIDTMFNTGQQAQAQELILEAVSAKFGGSAKAYGDTAAGSVAKIGNSVTLLEEELAKPLTSAPVRDALNDINKALMFMNAHPVAEAVTAGIIGVGAAWVIAEKAITIYQGLSNGVVATAAKNALGLGAEGAAADTAAASVTGLTGAEAAAGAAGDESAGQLALFAGAEDAVGGSAVAAAGEVDTLSGAMAAASGAASTLIGLLGTLAGVAAGAGVVYGAGQLDAKQSQHVGAISDKSLFGRIVNAGNVFPDWLQSQLDGKKKKSTAPGAYDSSLFGIGVGPYAGGETGSSGAGSPYGAFGNPNTGSINSVDQQGSPIDLFTPSAPTGGPTGSYTLGKNGAYFPTPTKTPKSGRGKGGGAAGAPTGADVANAQAILAGLFGLTPDGVAAALSQGLVTGKDPLTDLLTNAGTILTGTAKTLLGNFTNIMNAAIQVGQAAQKSLQFTLGSAAAAASNSGTISNASISYGNNVLTPQGGAGGSGLLGQLKSTLATDKTFSSDISKLRKLGLSPDLLNQYISAGPPSDLTDLNSLANSSASDITTINSTDRQVNLLAQQYGQSVAQSQYLKAMVSLLQQLLQAIPPVAGARAATTKSIGKAASLNARGGLY